MVISARKVVVAALCLLTACSAPAAPSANTSSHAASPGATPIATALESPTVVRTPTATAEEPILAVDGFAEVVTTDLVVRSAPGTGPDSEIYGTIEHVPAYVVDGPVQADGYEWWLVAHFRFDQLGGPPAGWVPARGQDGEVWLAPTRLTCPDAPTSEARWFMPSIWVGCYTGVELTLAGVLMSCDDSVWRPWDHVCYLFDCPPEQTPAACDQIFDNRAVAVHFDSLPAPSRGRITVTGYFDDPAAERCGVEGDPLSRLRVFECRGHFVAKSYSFTD